MLKVKKSIVVNAPIDQVFNYLSDLTRHGEWDAASNMKVTATFHEQMRVGFTCERTGKGMGYGIKKTTLTEISPNARIVYEDRVTWRGDPLLYGIKGYTESAYKISFDLAPLGRSTQITRSSEPVDQWWSVMGYLIWPVIQWWRLSTQADYLRRIKAKVERATTD